MHSQDLIIIQALYKYFFAIEYLFGFKNLQKQ